MIVYSLVARGSVILCSHQNGEGRFEEVVGSMLPNIPTRNDAKTTYTSNNYMFHVMVENGLIFMCAADTEFGRRQPYAFLTEIKRRFLSGNLADRAQFAHTNELDRDFSQVLAGQMETYSTSESNDQIGQLRSQVNEVKDVMTQNIEKVLERGENLEDLLHQTEDLEAHSSTFQKSARRVQRKYWWKNLKMKIILGLVVIVVLFVIILIILFSTGVLPPKNKDSHDSGTHTTPAP